MDTSAQPLLFVNYRRKESSGTAGRMVDSLKTFIDKKWFFIDVENLKDGEPFPTRLKQAIEQCQVFLAVIGPGWVQSIKADVDSDPSDWVRTEIALALRKKKFILPVLVDGAQMPQAVQLPKDLKALHNFNAAELSHSRWQYDISRLVATLETHGIPTLKKHRSGFWISVAVVVFFMVLYIVVRTSFEKQDIADRPATSQATIAPIAEGKWKVLGGASNHYYLISQNNFQVTIEEFVEDKRTGTSEAFIKADGVFTFAMRNAKGAVTNYIMKLSADRRRAVGRLSTGAKIGNTALYTGTTWEKME